MDIYSQIAVKIIAGQESIIGPVAIEQASQVPGLQVDWANKQVIITGDEPKAIDQLINKYRVLFGQISVEVSKRAVTSLTTQLPSEGLPAGLR